MRSTPWSRAKAVISVQKPIAASHWRSRSRTTSSGQGYQAKLTVVDPGPSPGVPDMLTIFVTPSSSAGRIVSRMVAACASPRTGWSGQAEQFSAASRRPRSSMASRQRSRAPGGAGGPGGGGRGGRVRRGEPQAPFLDGVAPAVARLGVREQLVEAQVRGPRLAAGRGLQGGRSRPRGGGGGGP